MPGPSVGNGPDRRFDTAVALVLTVGCVVLLEVGPGAEVALSGALRDTVLRPFLETQEWVGRRAELQERVDELVQENARLQAEVVSRRGLERENRTLRELASIAGDGGRFLLAEIHPGEPRLGVARRFLLSAGADRGVHAPAGVLVADGVVGVVRTTTADGSAGDFWTHPDYRISVRVRDGSATGIARPDDGQSSQPFLIFEGAPYQDEIPEGTGLITTGAGGIYPPGVPVGTIQGLAEVERGWARSYRVRPAVRPEGVSAALVWLSPPRGEGTDPAVPEHWRTEAGSAASPDTALPPGAVADTAGGGG